MTDEPLIHDPGNTEEIDHLYAFMSVDEHGHNGIIATHIEGLGMTPLVTGSRRVAQKMTPLAQEVAKRTGKAVHLFAFKRYGEYRILEDRVSFSDDAQ